MSRPSWLGNGVDIEEFYDENPVRRASKEFEFGRDWADTQGNHYELSWVQDTGELYLLGAPLEPLVGDGAGDLFLQRLPTSSVVVRVVGTLPTLGAVEEALAGWSDAVDEPNSVEWIRHRMAGLRRGVASGSSSSTVRDDEPDEVRGAGSARPTARADDRRPVEQRTGSAVISTLIKQLRKRLPNTERMKLSSYREQADQVDAEPKLEWRRAFTCARWAERTVSLPAHSHLAAEAARATEVVKEVAATLGSEIFDLELLTRARAVSPRFEAELAWVEEAANVAERVAAQAGWDAVPWEHLLQDMLAISPS